MTVTSEVSRSGPYNGNGATTVFPYEFKIFAAGDLLVTEVDLDGVETTLVNGVDYTVDGVLSDDGGDVTMTTALAGDGTDAGSHKLTIRRVLDATQTMNLRSQGKISAEVLERTCDRAVMLIQQLLDERDRSLRLIESEAGSTLLTVLPSLADRKGQALLFDPTTGQPLAGGVATATVSTAMRAVVAAATLAAARAAMGPWGDAVVTATGSPTARTAASRSADEVWAQDFGAVGDGVTDDTAALQDAITAAAGRVVRLRPGTYKTSAPLVASHGLNILGSGPAYCIIQGDHSGGIIQSANTAVRYYNWSISDIGIRSVQATAGSIGLDLTNITIGTYKNIEILYAETAVKLGGAAYYNDFFGLHIVSCTTGVLLGAQANETHFYGFRLGGVTTGFVVDGTSNVALYGGAIEGFTTGVSIAPTEATQYTKLHGVRFESGTTGVLAAVGAQSTLIEGCMFGGVTNIVAGAGADSTNLIHLSPDYASPVQRVRHLYLATGAHTNDIAADITAETGVVKVRNVAGTEYVRVESAGMPQEVVFTAVAVSTGISVNAGVEGSRCILALLSSQTGAGNLTGSAVYMIRCGYSGDNFTATKISGDDGGAAAGAGTFNFTAVGGILHVATSIAANGRAQFFVS